jgi:hypothetical protein
MDVFLLCHVRHARSRDGGLASHRDPDGELLLDEEAGDDVKLLGAYSTENRARDRITHARSLPGFDEEPDCFWIDRYIVDEDQWREGFYTRASSEDASRRSRSRGR